MVTINGKEYKSLVGSKAEVMHGTAYKTSYGKTKNEGGTSLTKKNLKYNKQGRIVSISKSVAAKKNNGLKNWAKENDLVLKKGTFGWQSK